MNGGENNNCPQSKINHRAVYIIVQEVTFDCTDSNTHLLYIFRQDKRPLKFYLLVKKGFKTIPVCRDVNTNQNLSDRRHLIA